MSKWKPIPGETPIDDLSGLKVKGITTRDQLSEVEADNILAATLKYLAAPPSNQLAPFDLRWSKKLHAQMFGEVWTWAGTTRKTQTNIGVPAHTIEVGMAELLADLLVWRDSEMPLIEQATRLHHRAVFIHPFLNGNGRWARMLGDIWLFQHGQKPTPWPADLDGQSPIRDEYLKALRQADEHNLEPLLLLYRRLIEGRGEAGQ